MTIGKLMILDAIRNFKNRNVPEGIAEIMKTLPHDYQFAHIMSEAFMAIHDIGKTFFIRGHRNMTRKSLAFIPFRYALDHPANPKRFVETAALMFKEVLILKLW
jgi:hypothetical protein